MDLRIGLSNTRLFEIICEFAVVKMELIKSLVESELAFAIPYTFKLIQMDVSSLIFAKSNEYNDYV